MRILLVDDSATIRAMQRAVLRHHGHDDLEEACDGVEALDKLDAFKPDLLLVDWDMPNMDGLTFVRTCRQRGIRKPIVLLATEIEQRRLVLAIDAGINNYLLKPFTADQLIRRVTETMSEAAA